MKTVILIIMLGLIGCAGTEKPNIEPSPQRLTTSCPVIPNTNCTDQLLALDNETLKKGFNCPNNSKLTFPSSYLSGDRVLVLCQCK